MFHSSQSLGYIDTILENAFNRGVETSDGRLRIFQSGTISLTLSQPSAINVPEVL